MGCLIEKTLGRARYDLRIDRRKFAAIEEFYELRLHRRRDFADRDMGIDIRPFGDEAEVIGVIIVPAENTILDLRGGFMERVIRAVIERIEKLDEPVARPGLHLEIIDVKIIPLRRQGH